MSIPTGYAFHQIPIPLDEIQKVFANPGQQDSWQRKLQP